MLEPRKFGIKSDWEAVAECGIERVAENVMRSCHYSA